MDVDDLVALALALGVSPSALLMPSIDIAQPRDEVTMTGLTDPVAAHSVWIWLTGAGPLPGTSLLEFGLRAFPRWVREHMEREMRDHGDD